MNNSVLPMDSAIFTDNSLCESTTHGTSKGELHSRAKFVVVVVSLQKFSPHKFNFIHVLLDPLFFPHSNLI